MSTETDNGNGHLSYFRPAGGHWFCSDADTRSQQKEASPFSAMQVLLLSAVFLPCYSLLLCSRRCGLYKKRLFLPVYRATLQQSHGYGFEKYSHAASECPVPYGKLPSLPLGKLPDRRLLSYRESPFSDQRR